MERGFSTNAMIPIKGNGASCFSSEPYGPRGGYRGRGRGGRGGRGPGPPPMGHPPLMAMPPPGMAPPGMHPPGMQPRGFASVFGGRGAYHPRGGFGARGFPAPWMPPPIGGVQVMHQKSSSTSSDSDSDEKEKKEGENFEKPPKAKNLKTILPMLAEKYGK